MTAAPTAGDASTPLPRSVQIGLLLVLAASFLHFWIHTSPVRLATSDDVAFQEVADQSQAADYLAVNARGQARFFYSTPIYRYALFSPYEVRNAWTFGLLRAVGYFAQIGLVAWLAARVMQSATFGAIVALLLVGTLHLPLTFYLVLSFPPSWIGFSALLGALHCHHTYLRRPAGWSGLMTGGLFLLAVLMHDVFIIFLPVFFALAWLQRKTGLPSLVRWNVGPATVAVAYVGVHRYFAREFPSAYAGTQFSPDFVVAAKVLVRQLIGVTPGFELLVNRVPADTTGPLFRDLPAIRETLGTLAWADGLLALVTALALAGALNFCLCAPLPRARLWPWALGCACLANLPIALSAKYQVFILHREYPYGYAWFSFCFLGLASAGALIHFGQRLPAGRLRRWFSTGICAGVFLLCLSALASNHRVLQILRERYN